MDTIHIKGLRLFAYHGVNPEEKRDGQTFLLDIQLHAGLSQARHSDRLDDTVNYAAVAVSYTHLFPASSWFPAAHSNSGSCPAG